MKTILELLSPQNPLGLMTAIVVLILVLSTLTVRLLSWLKPHMNLTEIRVRIRSWWMMAGLFLIALAITGTVTYVMMGLLSYVALKEYFTMLPVDQADRGSLFFSYLFVPIQFFWAYQQWYGMFIIFIPVIAFLFLPFRQLLAGKTAKFVSRTSSIQWGLMLFVFGLSHMAYLSGLGQPAGDVEALSGRSLLLFLVFLTEMNDVFQFLVGKTFGRRKISPSVSPNKTWEGFLGGLVLTSIGGVLIRFCTPFSWWQAGGIAALIAVSGFVGDLVVSAIKRDNGVKDSSQAIPGHGGVLDRVDSLCYTTPVFFHLVWKFWY